MGPSHLRGKPPIYSLIETHNVAHYGVGGAYQINKKKLKEAKKEASEKPTNQKSLIDNYTEKNYPLT